MSKITTEELYAMFGDEIPLEAVNVIMSHQGTVTDLRNTLEKMAQSYKQVNKPDHAKAYDEARNGSSNLCRAYVECYKLISNHQPAFLKG